MSVGVPFRLLAFPAKTFKQTQNVCVSLPIFFYFSLMQNISDHP